MKLLLDAHLPYKLINILKTYNIDAIHTDDLPNKERTTDTFIRQIADTEDRIVVTKDSDFLDSYYIKKSPKKLLLVTTGNISNKVLFDIFEKNISKILEEFKHANFIELNNIDIIVHN
ncbi:MAG: DUF5615 family PIN-like protein [Chitinophagales bacterium]|nr:DUF5615 family PIN-like protein [Chitinophagales bacterium]